MKTLLLDVGNTRLKWGVLDDNGIHRTGHVSQAKLRDFGLVALTSKLPVRMDAAYISNVAGPTLATRLSGVLNMHCGCDVHFAKSTRAACGITNSYRQPRRMGVDRWVALIGAWAEFESACLVVDAGTAVTIDAVDSDGNHLGGQIIAGSALMVDALNAETSDIPRVAVTRNVASSGLDMFANTTASAVKSGAANAVVGAVERAIRTLRSNAYKPALVLTGGDASSILKALDEEALHRPNLVLHGLARLMDEHQ